MNKTALIIKREYLTRVRKRTFIISTLLFPLLYVLLIFGTGYIAAKSQKNLRVALIDSSGLFNKADISNSNLQDSSSYLEYVTTDLDSVKKNYSKMGFDGYVVIPASSSLENGIRVLSLKTSATHGTGSVAQVQAKLNSVWNKIKSEKLGIDTQKRAILDKNISLKEENQKDKNADADLASKIGYTCGFLIYFILLIYGSQVMMGVMEEKTNRIAEVIISSIRPFQLMLGKIIGISMVALTQFLLWIAFIFIIYNITKASGGSHNMVSGMIGGVQNLFTSINLPLIIVCFAFYLLGGFFFYSSLYAAIGSAVNEDMREAQSLSLPVTMLVIFSIAMMTTAMADPTGKVAFWASIIPISSPIVMMALIPFGVPGTVPWWQLGLSMALLVVGFIFTTWFASKIYRTGILMYGKKPSWKEMIRWAFRKN